MKLVFAGTPAFAATHLSALIKQGHDIVAVYTQPDRAAGRGKKLQASPVKLLATQHNLPVLQPASLKDPEAQTVLAAFEPDLMIVVAYGLLLPKAVLDIPRFGCINVHASLLPRWRGAAPVQHAIRAGDAVTGVTTFVLDVGMDTGPILRQEAVDVAPDESAGALLTRLSTFGAPLLLASLRALHAGERGDPQPEEGATLAPKITPDDVAIDLTAPAEIIDRLVRSADPAPGAHTTFRGERLKVFAAPPVEGQAGDAEQGTVLAVERDGIVVACGGGAVRLTAVQPAGKPRMDAAAWANGARIEAGERFGDGEPQA